MWGGRRFLKSAGMGAVALTMATFKKPEPLLARPIGANDDLRLAVLGVGASGLGVGGRGRQLIARLREVQGVRLVAVCDADPALMADQVEQLTSGGERVTAYSDVRRVLDDKSVDAVLISMPDHWHALATIWACQARKDVYVEKPLSYNVWEGRQVVAAASKYGRIVQTGMQARSSSALRQAIDYVQRGEIGPIRYARIINYKVRPSIGKVTQPTVLPAQLDYNGWCGPAPLQPLMRKELHYDWHWVWLTGTGEMGNNCVHFIDMCRWALNLNKTAPRVMSFGGRFGYEDDGQTPNTQVTVLDYESTPVYCEMRGLPEASGSKAMDTFLGVGIGIVIQCEGGRFAGGHTGGTVTDDQGRKIKEFAGITWGEMEAAHLTNFAECVRSGNPSKLNADSLTGHISAACSHLANISWRIGRSATPAALRERTSGDPMLADMYERFGDHLRANGVDLSTTHPTLGPWLSFDADQERFVGQFADEANQQLRRPYREPFVVPEVS